MRDGQQDAQAPTPQAGPSPVAATLESKDASVKAKRKTRNERRKRGGQNRLPKLSLKEFHQIGKECMRGQCGCNQVSEPAELGSDDDSDSGPPPLVPTWWKPPVATEEEELRDENTKEVRSRQAMALKMCRDIESKIASMLKGDNPDWTDFVNSLGRVSSGPEWDRLMAAREASRTGEPGIMPLFTDEAINGLEEDPESSDESEEEDTAEDKEKEKRRQARKERREATIAALSDEFDTMPYPIIIDSGAAESVMPKSWCPQAALLDGPMKGKRYTAANGSYIRNEGEKVISMVTREGHWKDLKFQACDVTRPLASVYKICEAGHSVVFNPSWDTRGSYIVNRDTNDKMWLTERDGVYVLQTKVAPHKWQTKPSQASFARQGRR